MASSEIPLVGPIINKIFGTRNERVVRRLIAEVDAVNALEPQIRALTDAQLRAKTQELRARAAGGEPIPAIKAEALAVARESMDRNVGIRNIFDPRFREQFDASRLSPRARELYDQTRAAMDAAEPRPPEGDLLGNVEPKPGWVWTDIPNEIYDEVRALYPESRPPFRARPFDVQLIGATVLHQGKIAEMKTGEGKTIVAPLASYIAVIEGMKVHVVTVNDYLVQRDRDWTFPFFRGLGLTVGAIHPQHMQDEDEKRAMYRCDVVYGTTSEFGFDYLRDNMKQSADAQVQRAREFAIVDEVDSTLIDEARTPLIISGPAHEDAPRYELADQLARHLVKMAEPWQNADDAVTECKKLIKGTEGDIRNARDRAQVPALQARLDELRKKLPQLEAERARFTQYYEVERDRKQVQLTHWGVQEAQKKADLGSFYVGDNIDLPHLLQQALRSHVVYQRDVDYVIAPTDDPYTGRKEPDIVIVDVNTGRPMVGRQWSDGLHQACQAKEGLRVRQENQTVATVTIQNFFKTYRKLAGMTGTADTEAQEFYDIYKMDVVAIPTNLPVVRADFDDTVYLTAKDKWAAIVDEIKAFHDAGRPVLVGTTSVEKSEMLSKMLSSRHNIRHEVLNAKQHEREAHIVENAGQLGAVMIATNMAGRGTDIKLGRVTREQLLDHWKRRSIAPAELTADASDDQAREMIYRKIASRELDLQKRQAQEMPFPELELALLRRWAEVYGRVEPAKAAKMDAESIRRLLDEGSRFGLHRVGWVQSIAELGGLHVIGTERHESRRIDNQLRGRSGRQGDPGSSRFFISLEDDLMKLFAGEATMRILARLGMREGDSIEAPILTKNIIKAQRKVEERNFQIRKTILEYDEVMEHQRQNFYGTRQRVLEGRDVRGLIFEFLEDASDTAVRKYLDPDFRAETIAAWVSERLGCSVEPARFRNKERDDLIDFIRREAKDDARHEISVTIGEYIPEGATPEDIDIKGLAAWADKRFGVALSPDDVKSLSVRELSRKLLDAAEVQVDQADLSGIDQFLVPQYGARELSRWIRQTLGFEISPDEIAAKQTDDEVREAILAKARDAYDLREVEYPVDYAMDLTSQVMRVNPAEAPAFLARWASRKFGLPWDASSIRTRMPQELRRELIAKSRQFFESGRIRQLVDEAAAITDNDALDKLLREKYDQELPPWIARLRGEERERLVRARVESAVRAELVSLERFVLLSVLDPAWKDHLYEMDKLRDAIGFRSFSQLDPRIEYKKEGSRLYSGMLERVRDRVAEMIFKARIRPSLGMNPMGPLAPPPGNGDALPRPAP
ncbi:MAG: preprotein translocase subunit SecA, partial [Phycisphaerales bacterium]|nr:preprotein translocase subunit SecA [Phycisphaerales bacterium]